MLRILILGAGGVGGYFGGRLIQAGADVTFLVRPARQMLLNAQGLIVETPRDTFRLRTRTLTADSMREAFDLVLLSPKAYDLPSAIEAVRQVPGTPLYLPLLNGFEHLAVLDAEFGRERVMGGVIHIAVTLTDKGIIRQLNPLQILTFGIRHEAQQSVAESFGQLCEQAAFDCVRSPDIEQALWDKWTFLATLAGMTTLMRASVGKILATEFGQSATEAMYEECCAIASAAGQPIGATARQQALGILLKEGSDFTASMLRDLEQGQPTEHEHILGALVRRAAAHGLPCPNLRMAFTQLAIRQEERL